MCRIIITKYALSIDPVNVNDTGKYSCLAKNQFGEKWANFTLSVEGEHLYIILAFTVILMLELFCFFLQVFRTVDQTYF